MNAEPNPPSPQALEFFEKQVRPLLAENCYTCHSADTKPSGGLRVDDRRGLLDGGGRGPAVVPGDPDRSLLIRAVAYDGALQMPPKKQLNPEQIEVLRRWVRARQKMQKLQAEWLALTDPAANGPVAMGVRDAAKVGDTELRVRGEAEKLGPIAPRGFLSLINIPHARPINPQQSGRLELAAWLTDDANPLTSRVIVNRLWQHLFGEGIVRTVDNFGVTGDKPSHPELLDHLALRFVRDGWSTKKLIRSLVLTHSYQLSSATSPEHLAKDPANRLVWRHSPRRLDAEEIRDVSNGSTGVVRDDCSVTPRSVRRTIGASSRGSICDIVIGERFRPPPKMNSWSTSMKW